jgi:hypothetical protein
VGRGDAMTAGWPLRAAGSHAEPLSPVRWCPIHAQHDTQPLRRDMPSAARSLGACRCASCATHPKWHSGQSKVGMSISLRIVYRRGGYAEPLAANLPVPQGFSDPSQCLVRQGSPPCATMGGHLMQIAISLPSRKPVELCKCNSLIHLKRQVSALVWVACQPEPSRRAC